MLRSTLSRTLRFARTYTTVPPSNHSNGRKAALVGLLGLTTAANVYFFIKFDRESKQQTSDTFRLATLNVHFWLDNQNTNNAHRLAAIVKEQDVDVLALQEAQITDNDVVKFSKMVNLPFVAFGPGDLDNFGNAILSKHPITFHENLRTTRTDNAGQRGMLRTVIAHAFARDNKLQLYNTHLDHILEPSRVTQLSEIDEKLFKKDEKSVQLVVGDFNALTESDYSPEYLARITQVRAASNWELPKFEVTNWMKEKGFKDCFRIFNQDMDENVGTSRLGTRIDYIFLRGELKNGWELTKCKKFSAQPATDHHGLVIEFKKNKK
jgi:endonuclease/exonuclease/phosphatase family metal-dependent hydrolase